MKIILTQDVAKLGKKGDLVEVSPGYARNFLMKKKLGVEATGQALNDMKLEKAAKERRRAEELAEAKDLAKKIEDKTINIPVKAGENGKIFGSVSNKDISEAIKEQLNVEIDRRKIVLKDTIKNLGDQDIKIKLHPKITSQIKVSVVAGE